MKRNGEKEGKEERNGTQRRYSNEREREIGLKEHQVWSGEMEGKGHGFHGDHLLSKQINAWPLKML